MASPHPIYCIAAALCIIGCWFCVPCIPYTPYNTKLINYDILKSISDIMCNAIDSLKKDCYLKIALCG
jgi:hypothetical protein